MKIEKMRERWDELIEELRSVRYRKFNLTHYPNSPIYPRVL